MLLSALKNPVQDNFCLVGMRCWQQSCLKCYSLEPSWLVFALSSVGHVNFMWWEISTIFQPQVPQVVCLFRNKHWPCKMSKVIQQDQSFPPCGPWRLGAWTMATGMVDRYNQIFFKKWGKLQDVKISVLSFHAWLWSFHFFFLGENWCCVIPARIGWAMPGLVPGSTLKHLQALQAMRPLEPPGAMLGAATIGEPKEIGSLCFSWVLRTNGLKLKKMKSTILTCLAASNTICIHLRKKWSIGLWGFKRNIWEKIQELFGSAVVPRRLGWISLIVWVGDPCRRWKSLWYYVIFNINKEASWFSSWSCSNDITCYICNLIKTASNIGDCFFFWQVKGNSWGGVDFHTHAKYSGSFT